MKVSTISHSKTQNIWSLVYRHWSNLGIEQTSTVDVPESVIKEIFSSVPHTKIAGEVMDTYILFSKPKV